VKTPSPHRHVLVTGGAGFIGSHLVEALLAGGASVTVVDDLSTGVRANIEAALQAHGPRLHLVEAAVGEWARNASGFDVAYHLAASVGVRLVMGDPARAAERNVGETMALLGWASRTRTPVLFASSSEVYGKGVSSPFREDADLLFGPPTSPRWSYGLSKAIDEQMALAAGVRDGFPVVVARFFNTVGPRQRGRYGMVLPRFVAAARAGRPLEVHGSGRQVRCFGDVRDVVRALPAMMSQPSCHGAVFNLGSDRPISIEDLARLVVSTLGSRSEIVRVPYADAFGPGFEDLEVRIPDIGRARQAIGFDPRIPLEQTIRDIADHLASTPEAIA
jgi:UDP-glucose 4-epimerase